MLRRTALVSALAAATFGLACPPLSGGARAQTNCDVYAKTALKQQQDNERLKCNLSGEAWSSDLKAHLDWCATVSPVEWRKQAQKRDEALAACAAKK